jgi:hypothetical protein
MPFVVRIAETLHSLAPDLKDEKLHSELAQAAQIGWSRGIGRRGGVALRACVAY